MYPYLFQTVEQQKYSGQVRHDERRNPYCVKRDHRRIRSAPVLCSNGHSLKRPPVVAWPDVPTPEQIPLLCRGFWVSEYRAVPPQSCLQALFDRVTGVHCICVAGIGVCAVPCLLYIRAQLILQAGLLCPQSRTESWTAGYEVSSCIQVVNPMSHKWSS